MLQVDYFLPALATSGCCFCDIMLVWPEERGEIEGEGEEGREEARGEEAWGESGWRERDGGREKERERERERERE